MGLFDKVGDPIFLNNSNTLQKQIETLKSIEPQLNNEGKKLIQKDIKLLEYGLAGENAIIYELKNSHLPIYILHDVYFEIDGYSAQIDFVVYTRKQCFIIECKNLFGNITIDNHGAFIRNININNRYHKEGIYSPITQNERHLQVIKKIRLSVSSNLRKFFISKNFDDNYIPIVVVTNQKTVLNYKYAPKSIKDKVIRADQLITYIKTEYSKSKLPTDSINDMKQRAENLLKLSKQNFVDYTRKYDSYIEKDTVIPNEYLYTKLKVFRKEIANVEGVPAYFIFNNEQLDQLILKYSKTMEDIKSIKGFGDVKIQKYGQYILNIFNEVTDR